MSEDKRDLEREIDRQIERDVEAATREAAREARHAEREARRSERQAEREARHEARRQGWRHSFGLLGGTLTVSSGDDDDREESESVERRFEIAGMPRLRIRNVSGATSIGVGGTGEVLVRARKRVRGWSEDRAKRLLENVEIRMEQHDDEIVIEPHLYEQERGWLDLFRGGRVAVDIEVTVPRESQIDATTVSGPLRVAGTRGPLEGRSVSGDVVITDVQGPVRLRSVSGDIDVTSYAGQAEANSVSGDISFERSRVKRPDIVTVSGEVRLDGALIAGDADGKIKTVSGDVELRLAEPAVELEFQTLSGDIEVDSDDAKVEKKGRREWSVKVGRGGSRLKVKTVSGDLAVRRSGPSAPADLEVPAADAIPMGGPTPAARPQVLDLLERVARGEVSVDDAAAALDERR